MCTHEHYYCLPKKLNGPGQMAKQLGGLVAFAEEIEETHLPTRQFTPSVTPVLEDPTVF